MVLRPKQAIRVLGLLGALDPYKHKVNIGMIDQSRDASAVSLSESKSSQDSGRPGILFHHSQFEEYFINAFMDSAILPSYTCPFKLKFLYLTVDVLSGAFLLFILLYHQIIIYFWHDHVGQENWFDCYSVKV